MRDGFIFYRSFFESAKALKDDEKLELYEAIFEYALNQKETETKPLVSAFINLMKPQIDANNRRYENGKKGGRPPKEKTETKPKNNLDKTKAKAKEKEKEKEKEYIVEYLNNKTSKKFKASSTKTKSLIDARLKDGFTKDDFVRVIDIKCSQWLNDEKMKEYLRPETLFGTKFESYLNSDMKKQAGETTTWNF